MRNEKPNGCLGTDDKRHIECPWKDECVLYRVRGKIILKKLPYNFETISCKYYRP